MLALAACAGAEARPEGPGPPPAAEFARPLQVYRQLGLMTGPERFPAVASLTALAGPADSTLLLVGLSLPASALRFQRSGDAFAADYRVSLRATRDGQPAGGADWRETVRVPAFAETARTDESVLFQGALTLAPGRYTVTIRARDGLSARGFEAVDTVELPAFATDRTLATPVLAYRALPRAGTAAVPRLVLNPRLAAPYGGDTILVYVERYGPGADAAPVRVEVRTADGLSLWARDVTPTPGVGLAAAVTTLPVDSLPLGRYSLSASVGGERSDAVPLLVTISDGWMVANFDEVLELLRYIASPEELEPLTAGGAEERRARWDAFWAARDPVPATPVNEYRETFFERLRVATEQFAEGGSPGWRTDRGEVYVVLGPPSDYLELAPTRPGGGPGGGAAQEWVYHRVPGGGRLSLVFVDPHGFGTYRLTDGSAAAFRAVARRVRNGHAAP